LNGKPLVSGDGKAGNNADLTEKTLAADGQGELGAEHVERHGALLLEVLTWPKFPVHARAGTPPGWAAGPSSTRGGCVFGEGTGIWLSPPGGPLPAFVCRPAALGIWYSARRRAWALLSCCHSELPTAYLITALPGFTLTALTLRTSGRYSTWTQGENASETS
jgi:hypothetical protein